jgi:site-specific DNA-methyltransferase (adenine-specific)
MHTETERDSLVGHIDHRFIDSLEVGNCVDIMNSMPDGVVDLTVTSPPYDNLRDYKGYSFPFEAIAQGLYRVTKKGGVVVWVVGDRTVRGNRSLTSFRQALYFQEIGFNVHDVMIYKKKNTPFMRSNAYTNCYEFMFVFTKGSPSTFNPLKEKSVRSGLEKMPANKGADGVNHKVLSRLNETKSRNNIWEYAVGLGGTTRDRIAFKHPAVYPEKLAEDHILSWTNYGDLVFDCMAGSGTTLKMAKLNNRKYFGCDISQDYIDIARERLRMVDANGSPSN